jgi:hypothetical protein
MSRIRFIAVFLLCTVALAGLDNAVQAQFKPFKVKGTGDAPDGLSILGLESPYSATGTATHLGKYTGIGFAQVTGDGTFTGAFLFVAANGDMLLCEHPGTFEVIPDGDRFYAVIDAIFTPVAGTGRFADVVGGFRMIATTEPFDFAVGGTTPFELKWRGKGELGF